MQRNNFSTGEQKGKKSSFSVPLKNYSFRIFSLSSFSLLLHYPLELRTFNNADINKFDLHKWRRQIKVVSQQTKLFIGTIADNISMFSDSLENVELFCKTMQLDWFFKIEDLKLHNMVDENGNNLSGGQKQLIGIARALYQSAPILVLDEPTASMDKECELEVIQLLFRLKKDMIIIMITHKPEIAKMSDKIYILDNKHMTVCDDYLLL